MCVICRKPFGKKLPDAKTILDMWADNPHGAGIMWRDGNKTRYVKGFMDKDAFMKFVDDNHDMLESTECAMHFRIATHGGVNPENTHPFPMDRKSKPDSMEGCVSFCMMHNGVLPLKPRTEKISDTAELSIRASEHGRPMEYLDIVSEFVMEDNRIVAFAPDKTLLIGDWTEIDGCDYSNTYFIDDTRYASYWNNDYYSMGYDYHYDRKSGKWKDALGHIVDITWVDPYSISEEDEYVYWNSIDGNEDQSYKAMAM